MAELGGVISVHKSEWHKDKALFCEVPFYKSIPQKFTFLSYWVAPPGGSKGSINWLSQSLTVSADNRSQGKSHSEGLWSYSPLWRTQQAAYLMGLPIGAPPEFGGALHPKFPAASRSDHFKWLTYLSSLSASQLIAGTGLAVMPSPFQDLRNIGARKVQELLDANRSALANYSELVQNYVSQGGDPSDIPVPQALVTDCAYAANGRKLLSMEEVCDLAAAPLIAWELYFRAPIIAESAPSVRRAVQRFKNKVKKHRPIPGRYSNVRREVARKQAAYVRRNALPTGPRYNVYGLEQATLPKRTVLKHWVQGRVAWR
jgi:hypothetical protein